MKSTRLDTTSSSKVESSFFKDVELNTIHSPQAVHQYTTWQTLQEAVQSTHPLAEVWVKGSEPLPERGKMLVLAAVALDVGDEMLLREVEKAEVLKDYVSDWRQTLDRDKVREEAVRVCVDYDLENVACHIIEKCTKLPLYIVHRAGEKGHLRLLKAVSDFKIHLCPSSVLAAAADRWMRLIRKPCHILRFCSSSDFLPAEDVLRWSFLEGGEPRVREVLEWGLAVTDEALVRVLLSEGMRQLLEYLVSKERIRLTVQTSLSLLAAGQLSLLISFVEVTFIQGQRSHLVHRTPALLRSSEVVERLIALVSEVPRTLSALRLLEFIHGKDWNLVSTQRMYLKMEELLSGFSLEASPFANHCNPLMLAVALSETCEYLSHFQLQFQEKFQQIARRFRDLADKIQSQFTEYRQLKVLYTERVYGNKCLFDIITGNTERYRSLLRSHTVVAIARDLWSGGAQVHLDFERLCLATRLLASEGQEVFKVHHRPETSSFCLFRLSEWKRNNSLKFLIEAFGLICVYATMVVSVVLYTTIMRQLKSPTLTLEEAIVLVAEMKDNDKWILIYRSFIWMLILNSLQTWTYVHILGRPILIQLKDVMDIALFALAVFNQSFGEFNIALSLSDADIQLIMELSFAFMFLVAGFRMVLTLLITRSFGPMIRMVFIVMKDVGVFFGIFLLALVSFSIFASTLFYMEPEFSDIFMSLRTLYQWSLSGVDFSVFSEKMEWGSMLGVVWMFISAIILLNLLIAVLSVRYEELAPQCTADYVSAVYRQYSLTHYEEPYGALVMAPTPFTFITIPLMPIYFLFPKSAKHLNHIFVILTYQPIFLLGLLSFVLYSIAYSVLAFFCTATELARRLKWFHLGLWLTLGSGYLIWLFLLSLGSYCKLMYQEDEPEDIPLPPEILHSAIKFLTTLEAFTRNRVLKAEDLSAVLARLPNRAAEVPVISTRAMGQVVAKVIQSRGHLSLVQRTQVRSFFEQFKSYKEGGEEDEGNGVFDLGRMAKFCKIYMVRPEKLAAINVFYVQKALSLLQADYSLKKKNGKAGFRKH